METMPLENKKTEWQAYFPLRVPFNRTGEIQSLEERAVFTKQVYVSSKVFDLHEIPLLKCIITMSCACALRIIYILGRNPNWDMLKKHDRGKIKTGFEYQNNWDEKGGYKINMKLSSILLVETILGDIRLFSFYQWQLYSFPFFTAGIKLWCSNIL